MMKRQTREDKRAQQINPNFALLTQLVYFTSCASAAVALLSSVLFHNAGMAIAGISTATATLYVLSPSQGRASQIAATLLVQSDDEWNRQIADLTAQSKTQINTLLKERESLLETRLHLTQNLAQMQSQLDRRQQDIDALKLQLSRLEQGKRLVHQRLSAQLSQVQASLETAQAALDEKRYDLSVHLDAIEIQILDIWNPLYAGLIAICDRFDPTRPVSELEYAGKPVTLDETEKRKWKHYRDSLTAYDTSLRSRINAMSEECETNDEAYGFFLRLLEELTVNYCKLWANIKDLELLSVYRGEKQSIYSEFENFRSHYVSEASQWVEKSTTVEAGFDFIEQSFKNELASLQQRIVDAEGVIEQLEAPRRFRGASSIDQAGNRIIEHFSTSGVILDAIESVKIPGGFQLRFKVDRNPDGTRLTESEFDKHCEHLGLWGLSQKPLDFDLDTNNFLLSVNLFVPADGSAKRSTLSETKRSTSPTKAEATSQEVVAERFQELDCYSAAEFEEVLRLKCVPRVRVVAGSTGGKSPLLELFACAIAQIHKGELWLINPIPGSPKDWFHVPGVVPPGSNGIQAAISWLRAAHHEFKLRRNNLPGSAQKPFITVVVDEINAIARDFPDLGTVMKDFYQLSDHTRMSFLTAG